VAEEAGTPDPAPEEDPRKRREFFALAPLRAAERLRKALPVDEVGYRRVGALLHDDARAYYLYGVLDEVVKASMAGMRWLELLGEAPTGAEKEARTPKATEGPEAEGDDHLGRPIFESVVDEQEMWGRKLTEILLDLILFSTTNEQEFYRLYLACKELDAYVGLQKDFDEFFGCRSANANRTIDRLLGEIGRIKARLDFARAWFVAKGVDFQRPPAPGRGLQGARQRFILAQAVASTDLRLVIGGSYEVGYSTPSRSVHPNIGGPTRESTEAEVAGNVDKVGLLALNVIALAHDLTGIKPEGESAQVVEALRRSEGPDRFRRTFQRELDVGDIVFAYGDLCQIVEAAKSKHGNTSLKVRYLIRPAVPGVDEDWFPSRYVQLLYRRRDIKPAMVGVLRRTGATEAQVAEFERLGDEQVAEILAKTFTRLEEDGVLGMMLRPPRGRKGEDPPTAPS
jgi:hypothetical protein